MSRITPGTLVANVVTTVSVDSFTPMITVVNRSQTGEIFFTVDGTTPGVGTAGYVCLGSRAVAAPAVNTPTIVKLISSSPLSFSVEGEAA